MNLMASLIARRTMAIAWWMTTVMAVISLILYFLSGQFENWEAAYVVAWVVIIDQSLMWVLMENVNDDKPMKRTFPHSKSGPIISSAAQ